MQYMSVSHGYSTMGGIEYNDGGYVEKTKKRKAIKKQKAQKMREKERRDNVTILYHTCASK